MEMEMEKLNYSSKSIILVAVMTLMLAAPKASAFCQTDNPGAFMLQMAFCGPTTSRGEDLVVSILSGGFAVLILSGSGGNSMIAGIKTMVGMTLAMTSIWSGLSYWHKR